jgi:hypothetical protein
MQQTTKPVVFCFKRLGDRWVFSEWSLKRAGKAAWLAKALLRVPAVVN